MIKSHGRSFWNFIQGLKSAQSYMINVLENQWLSVTYKNDMG